MRKSLIIFSFFALLSLVFTTSCSKEVEAEKEPFVGEFSIEGSYTFLDIQQEGGSTVFALTTNYDWDTDLQFVSDSEWCRVERQSATSENLVLTCDLSEDAYMRTANVTLKSPLKDITITVRQLGYGPELLVNTKSFNAPVAGDSFDVKVTTNVEYTIKYDEGCDWISESTTKTKAIEDYTHSFKVDETIYHKIRNAVITFSQVGGDNLNVLLTVSQDSIADNFGSLDVFSDIKYVPTSATASSEADYYSNGIEKSFDGDAYTIYHTRYGYPNETVSFPVTIEYNFTGQPDLDYLIYHPRKDGGVNGHMGEFDIYYTSETYSDYQLIGSYDFGMAGSSSTLFFPSELKGVTKIKFSVKTGYSNHVSCSEMEFYAYSEEKASLDENLLKVFTDMSCSELKSSVADSDINALPTYLAQVARKLQNNEYSDLDKEFRIREYEAYSKVDQMASEFITYRHSDLNNCTGVTVNAGDSIVVLVGDTHGETIYLRVIENDGVAAGTSYLITEGVNSLVMSHAGMCFIDYSRNNPGDGENIKVHIPVNSGRVDGFFDLEEHKTDEKYAELLKNAQYPYFFIRGTDVILYFDRTQLLKDAPSNMVEAITLWDNIFKWELDLCGLSSYRKDYFNNRLLAMATEDNYYMSATEYRIKFNNSTIYLVGTSLLEDNLWGPAHEVGHTLQDAINWTGCTECSNNLLSNYVTYKVGKVDSRGNGIDWTAKYRYIENNGWVKYQNMDTESDEYDNQETKMRMYWQLFLYFHHCGINENFWQDAFNELRKSENKLSNLSASAAQMKFVEVLSKVSNTNLTDFFDFWGFFTPMNEQVEDYSTVQYTVTQSMIDATKAVISQYPDPKYVIQYIEDRADATDTSSDNLYGNVGATSAYTNYTKITKSPTYTLSDRKITITDGDEAVAFEIEKDGEVIYVFNFFTMDIPSDISLDGITLNAVQVDGVRKAITKS